MKGGLGSLKPQTAAEKEAATKLSHDTALAKIKEEFKKYAAQSVRYSDEFFKRFLVARNYDVAKTKKMLTGYFSWREEADVESITKTEYKNAGLLRRNYEHGYHGVDKQGRPIYIDRIGSVNVTTLLNEVTEQEVIDIWIQEYEHLVHVILPACAKQNSDSPAKTLTIVDMKNFNMRHVTGKTRKLLNRLTRISQDYYPEILGQMVIINTPGVFQALWNIVKLSIDEKTRSKISMYGTNWKPHLHELCDLTQLPAFLGGSQADDADWLRNTVGPWSDPTILCEVKKERTFVPEILFKVALSEDLYDTFLEQADGLNPMKSGMEKSSIAEAVEA
eukprot:GHVU01145677.1.p1 GENE.GHVU01145677.1~~GHVU01145677.1.p1  ORF type:complete len:333 (-),score=73.29 GHVU01145677.1:675-1673(-)